MKINRSCRDVTRLVLEAEARPLRLSERIGVQLHLWICKACPIFARQVQLMRSATASWRTYSESDELPR